jgi:cytochrome bd-type quinol oxidase subunit 2
LSIGKRALNAPLQRRQKDFNESLVLLVGLVYSIANGLSHYYRFDVWETTSRYQKVVMICGVISVVLLPFVVVHTIYLYIRLHRKDKAE